jgi:hypothetical protein
MVSENTYKKTSAGILQFINTCASLLKVLLRSKAAPNLPAPEGEKILVLGTGPSLKKSLLKNQDYFSTHPLMAVNTFSLSEEYVLLKPTYYVMVDPGLWHGDNHLVKSTMDSIAAQTSWTMYLLLPYDAMGTPHIARLKAANTNIRISYINYVVFKGIESISYWFFKKNKAMPQSQNVLVASLFLAINLGYKKIELFGADHNWHEQLVVDENNVVCLKHIHFYENEQRLKVVPLFKLIHSQETFRMDEIYHAWAKVFAGHRLLERYSKHCGSSIINKSEISFIDAFKREKFE